MLSTVALSVYFCDLLLWAPINTCKFTSYAVSIASMGPPAIKQNSTQNIPDLNILVFEENTRRVHSALNTGKLRRHFSM